MPSKKIVSDSYTIKSPTVIIDGNLNVVGTQTTISTTDSSITDNIIVLNDGELGTGIALGTAGIMVDRGGAADVGIRYDEDTDKWQLTNDGTTWTNILSSAGSGLGLENVAEDLTPSLGGDLALNGFAIVNSDDLEVLDTRLYFGAVGSAGSGLYIDNTGGTDQELVIKKKAMIFSLIF